MHDLLKMLDNPRSLLNFSLAVLVVLAVFFMLKSGGHLRFTKAERPVIHTSSTPSDRRAVRNAVAMLARADRKEVILV
ncbi:type II toxin-antitoxin system HicA family toxin [Pseudomonas aeruginosa]|uniref:type II toxin-antitoxin system HicA family toxin n=1 Tax=Pseudomonas aeruginosa TaxID=287 RepID=UPI0021F199C9|nr:type II toxin-antitoxin system HicA family toxin [Pseudomonas aeruginosa]UYM63597.1 type II toxin-antitoxin system HicA family toxin [Pseudomonas aeruginosa]